MTAMPRKLHLPILLALFAALALALSACGDDDSGDSTSSAGTSAETSTEATAPGDDGGGAVAGGPDATSLTLTADPDGGLEYEESAAEAQSGEIEITFDNPSNVIHDVVIEDSGGNTIAESERVTGESTSFTADLDAGEYVFYCSLTGHRNLGMEGPLTVE